MRVRESRRDIALPPAGERWEQMKHRGDLSPTKEDRRCDVPVLRSFSDLTTSSSGFVSGQIRVF